MHLMEESACWQICHHWLHQKLSIKLTTSGAASDNKFVNVSRWHFIVLWQDWAVLCSKGCRHLSRPNILHVCQKGYDKSDGCILMACWHQAIWANQNMIARQRLLYLADLGDLDGREGGWTGWEDKLGSGLEWVCHGGISEGGSCDDVIKWKHFLCYWPFVRGIHCPSQSEQTVKQTIEMQVIWDAIALIMMSL